MNKSMILSLIVRSRLHSALCGFSETKCAVVVALTIFGLLVSADTTFAASCLAPNPDYGTGTVTINAAAGTYRVWSRIMAGNASTDDSYSLDVDSANCYTVGDSGISVGTWTWIDYVDGNTTSKLNVTLSAGEHVLKMVGREAGVKIDRIIITTDMACIPSGTGDNCVSIDVTPPISPTNLSANATGSSSITVSWTAATDNIGVTSYQVERCQGSSCSSFIQVGTPSSSPFVDSGLTTSTSYSYHVRAVDAAGNTSAWSNVVSATTQPSSTPTSCSTITTPTDWNTINHTGYATPYDLFNNNTLIVQADCTQGSPTILDLSIGNTTDPTLFSLMTGYYWDGSAWQSYTTPTCSGQTAGSWCQGKTTGTITSTSINTANSTTPQYFLGFTCKYTGSLPWKCGCQDTACTTPSWQLQGAGL